MTLDSLSLKVLVKVLEENDSLKPLDFAIIRALNVCISMQTTEPKYADLLVIKTFNVSFISLDLIRPFLLCLCMLFPTLPPQFPSLSSDLTSQ